MKKILIITYHWPPSGGVTVLRPLKFVKYLRLYGWEPIIYTAKNPSYQITDKSLMKDVPSNLTIFKKKIWEPYLIYKKLSFKNRKFNAQDIINIEVEPHNLIDKLAIWIRANFFIPDARAFWIKPSVRFLIKYLKKAKVDLVYSNGPPHTNNVIAALVSQKSLVPWVVDLQDPWTKIGYGEYLPFSKKSILKHSKFEKITFNTASRVITVSKNWENEFKKNTFKPVDTISWGFDEEDFHDLVIDTSKLVYYISHIGTLGIDRFPNGLILALNSLFKKNSNFRERFFLNLVGQVDYRIKNELNNSLFADRVRYYGQVTRPQALKFMVNSSVLLLIVNTTRDSLGRIPAKTFEYLRAQRPIICFADKDSSTAEIISKYSGHLVTTHDNWSLIEEFIKYNLENDVRINNDISHYEMKYLTRRLASICDEIK